MIHPAATPIVPAKCVPVKIAPAAAKLFYILLKQKIFCKKIVAYCVYVTSFVAILFLALLLLNK